MQPPPVIWNVNVIGYKYKNLVDNIQMMNKNLYKPTFLHFIDMKFNKDFLKRVNKY